MFLTLYTLGIICFAIGALGGGHGSLLFIPPLVTWIAFLLASTMILWAENKAVLVLVIISIAVHYAASFTIGYLIEAGDDFQHTSQMIKQHPVFIGLGISWYLAGQVVFWYLLFKRIRNNTFV
jgi:hypothetical protein